MATSGITAEINPLHRIATAKPDNLLSAATGYLIFKPNKRLFTGFQTPPYHALFQLKPASILALHRVRSMFA